MTPVSGMDHPEFDGAGALARIRELWLANLIHDLCGPLFTARGYVRLALEERSGPLTESSKRYLTAALENIGRLSDLADELSEFQDIRFFDLEFFNFRDLVKEVLAGASSILLEKNVRLTQDLAQGTIPMIGDRGKLCEVLRSFVATAVHFTRPDGAIDLVMSQEEDKVMLQFGGSPVHGNGGPGPGLPINERFWRMHGGRTSARLSEEHYTLICELPIVRSPEC